MLVYSDNSNFSNRDTVIEQWQKFAKDVASAVKFYKKYHNSYEEFITDFHEEVKGKYYLWLDAHNFQTESDREKEFNAWLFDYTFNDVIE